MVVGVVWKALEWFGAHWMCFSRDVLILDGGCEIDVSKVLETENRLAVEATRRGHSTMVAEHTSLVSLTNEVED
jgi:hypothetical protein